MIQVTMGLASCLSCSICHTYVICSHIDKTNHILSHCLINDDCWSATNLSGVWLYYLRYITVSSMPANYIHQVKNSKVTMSNNTQLILTSSNADREVSDSAKPPAGLEESCRHGLPPPPASLASVAQQRLGSLISTGLEKQRFTHGK